MGQQQPDEADNFSKKLFYILIAATVAYCAAVFIFVL